MRKKERRSLLKWILALGVLVTVILYVKSTNLILLNLLASLFTGAGSLLALIKSIQGYGMDPGTDGFWGSLVQPKAAKIWQKAFLLFTAFGLLVISGTFFFIYIQNT
ncbi:MAG: hypothetical protein US86_C0001G0038 [Candidatus Daviesbacteria bacterium GW2011_GWA2_38_24]|uniref:Uncharacterized protein n=1 Tax=Candidatus Daviesbacteria bacterium GW2011_GWA2_38_24 TaxID=1618422 RepID=A0A0G0MQD1_9BACT|nr:MAG: hypothetical protein US86_C0001G0038 [Candidatus Daviesbacteria bacterium GW2011_GWA2_38_24]OGE22787.1 MAG: hypothetical protein A2688_00845 [Candidatus Daviesbacteria bacterium RIFCSPHIGHO2_01_FULL_38_8]